MQRIFFEILLNQLEIRLYLPIDLEPNRRRFGSKLIGKKILGVFVSICLGKVCINASIVSLRGSDAIWKNNNDRTYGCPRDLSLLASWGGPTENHRTSQHYRIEGLRRPSILI